MRGRCGSLCRTEDSPGTSARDGAALEGGRKSPHKTPAAAPGSQTVFDGEEGKLLRREADVEDGLGDEGQIKSMPRLARSRPSDRAARRKALEARLRVAHEKAAAEAALPLIHGRCCLMGLTVLELIRAAAWWQGTIPGYSVFGMHFLTTTSDIACILCAFPLFLAGTQGQCVQLGCLGPMLTLVFAMSLVDISALGAYLVVATPRPLSPGAKSYVDALEACVGVWEFALVASVALQMALCASSWRVYRELRMTGLYPPGSDPAGVGKIREISIMEVMCEAEDVELLADCEVHCESSLKSPLLVEAVPPNTAPSTPAATSSHKPSAEAGILAEAAKVPDGLVEVDDALCDAEAVNAVKCKMRPPVAAPCSMAGDAAPPGGPPPEQAGSGQRAAAPEEIGSMLMEHTGPVAEERELKQGGGQEKPASPEEVPSAEKAASFQEAAAEEEAPAPPPPPEPPRPPAVAAAAPEQTPERTPEQESPPAVAGQQLAAEKVEAESKEEAIAPCPLEKEESVPEAAAGHAPPPGEAPAAPPAAACAPAAAGEGPEGGGAR